MTYHSFLRPASKGHDVQDLLVTRKSTASASNPLAYSFSTMTDGFSWWPGRGASKPTKSLRPSDDETRATPSAAMYGIEGAKALADALESVSDLIPLPFLSTFLKVGVKVLEACEEATDIEENAADLQRRVYNLMLVVVDTVPVNRTTSLELRERIKKLQIILDSILSDMDKLKEQRKWLQVLFHDRNKERVDKCVARLNAALEQFNLAGQLRVEESQLRVEDLLEKIKADYSAFAAQLNRIEDAVKKATRPHNAPSARPRQDMPMPHHIFYGRDGLVDDIASLLVTKSTSRVCITGVGGMGKTSVALAVTETMIVKNTFLKEYIFWVPCIEAKSSDLLRHILYAQLRITAESYDSLDPLIAELESSTQRRLLLLDNFETPWLSGQDQDRAKVDDILIRLAKLPHIALLVTMTSGFTPGNIAWKHRPLPALDPDAARDAFKSKYRDAAGGHELAADVPELDEFLATIGHIPLAITLTAASGGRVRTSPAKLLRDWDKAGTAMMSGEKGSMDKTIRLSMEREAVTSNPEALTLLAILSMLPAGTTGDNLEWWAPTLSLLPAAVETLCLAALIEQDDGPFEISRIFVRPTIQAYMAHQDRIPAKVQEQVHDACYKFVLDHKSIADDHKFKDDLTALAGEETNIQGILMEVDANALRPNAVDALIAFSLYQSYTKPSMVVAAHALRVALAAYDDPRVADLDAAARRVAEAYQCLGNALASLDRWDEACKPYQEACARFKGLREADLCLAGECSKSLLDTRMYLGTESSHELESLAEEARADLCHDETKKYYVAQGLLGFGDFLWWGGRRDEALETLSAAQSIFEELDCPASTAECLEIMARIYADRNEYPEALRIARNGLVKAEQSGARAIICRILSYMAGYLILQQSYEDALVALTRLLVLCQASGSPLGIGQNLELLAYICAARLDLQGARAAYSGAQAQFRKIESTSLGREGVARCSDNLAALERIVELTQNDFSNLTRPEPMF